MNSIKAISVLLVIALGMMPLMALTTQATVTGTQILDSQADISAYDYSGDYIAYYNPTNLGYHWVKLYNYKTDTVTSVFNSTNLGSISLDGNDMVFTDRSNTSDAKLRYYNVATQSLSVIVSYQSWYQYYHDVGDGHVMYTDRVNYGNYTDDYVRIKTLSGTQVWSRNVTNEFVFDFNINNGFAMYSNGDRIRVYNISTGYSFSVSGTRGGFVEYADTDGTTLVFHEGGEYPNEYTQVVTYDLATGTKKNYSVPNSASNYKVCDGMIYYVDGTFGNDYIYWMDIDGTGVEQVSDLKIQGGHGFIVEGGKAVSMDPDDWSILHMYDTAGMGGSTTPTDGNVIGTLGGQLTTPGAKMTVPAGSLSGDVEFSINEMESTSANILKAFQILPNDIAFDPAAQLELDIPGTRAAGNELMRLENGQWVGVESTPSSGGNSLIAQITQTGTYAVTVARDIAEEVVDTAGGIVNIDGAALDIPADALSGLTDVSIEEVFVEGANVAQAVAVDIGGAILSIPAQLQFNIPATIDQADAVIGQLVGNAWIEVESMVNSAGLLVADITEGGIYAIMELTGGSGIDIPFPSGMVVLAIMLSTGLAVGAVRRKYYKE